MKFNVYDLDGNNVTDEKQWFLSSDGILYYLTNDIDNPLQDASDDYWYGD